MWWQNRQPGFGNEKSAEFRAGRHFTGGGSSWARVALGGVWFFALIRASPTACRIQAKLFLMRLPCYIHVQTTLAHCWRGPSFLRRGRAHGFHRLPHRVHAILEQVADEQIG